MESKKDKGIRILKKYSHLMTCPICQADIGVDGEVLSCKNGHKYDISKKGYVNLFGRSIDDFLYNKELFLARRRVFKSGFFQPLIEILSSLSHDSRLILDAGCGEGSILAGISNQNNHKSKRIGIDISKISISQATNISEDILFLVADLSNIPIKENSCDCLINVLSPANYSEFARILKAQAKLIKVIPGPDYLKEIRELLNLSPHENQSTALLKQNISSIETKKLYYKQTVSKELFKDICHMTPLSIDKNVDLKNIKSSREITIDLEIHVGKCCK